MPRLGGWPLRLLQIGQSLAILGLASLFLVPKEMYEEGLESLQDFARKAQLRVGLKCVWEGSRGKGRVWPDSMGCARGWSRRSFAEGTLMKISACQTQVAQ